MSFTEHEVGRALEQGEFVPYFQPLVDLRSGAIHGFEILARWRHPALGVVSPAAFIPLIEQYRLMNNLTASLLIPAFSAAHAAHRLRSLCQPFADPVARPLPPDID